MSLIRNHAARLAILTVLAAAVVAPYLIPENPDAAVFRNGVLAALLLAGCFIPVRDALLRCTRRELTCGFGYGLLFALALSIGSELFVYNGFLPGLGSAIRRAIVPVMAAPLLGSMCARLMIMHTHVSPAGHTRRIPAVAFAAVLLLCWLPAWLAYFPGLLNYDFVSQYRQHLYGYSMLHPLLHSVIMNGLISLGARLYSPTFGLFLYTAVQMIVFSLSLGYACAFAQKRGIPSWMLALLTAFFALHPIFPIMGLSATKDTLFAAAVLIFSLEIWAFLEEPASYSRMRFILCALTAAGVAWLRNNGLFALVLMLPAIPIAARGQRRRAVALCGLCILVPALVMGALQIALHPGRNPANQYFSLPAQQLVRAYNLGVMSDEDRTELESWYVDTPGLLVKPHLADGAKGYIAKDRLQTDSASFLSLWARVGKDNLRVYAEALLLLNIGSWYPDDLSHATIYADASYVDLGYIQTINVPVPDENGIDIYNLFPAARTLYERICRRNRYQRYPIAPILFCPATPFWMLILAITLFHARKKSHLIPSTFGVLGLWLSYLFGPCTLPRYVLPLFCLAPVLLAVALTNNPTKEVKS